MDYKALFPGGWYGELKPFIDDGGIDKIFSYLKTRLQMGKQLYPASDNVFKAFQLTPLDKVKVVIVGQDPYHTPGMAMGLSFSVPETVHPIPPSLLNIRKELESDLDILRLELSDLTSWAEQGVLLLNTAFTVEKGTAGVHAKLWAPFTEWVFSALMSRPALVYMLWGNHAKNYINFIDKEANYVLTAAHPSPFSAHKGFFGCKHFSKTNKVLTEVGLSLGKADYTIKW